MLIIAELNELIGRMYLTIRFNCVFNIFGHVLDLTYFVFLVP